MATESGAPAELAQGRFAGREAFAQHVRDALASAARREWRAIVFCDATFEDWPLHERQVLESLQAWSRTGRRFTMLASRYDAVIRHHARFVGWRRTWGHIIDCRICPNLDPVSFPSALWTPQWALRRLDLVRSTGVCGPEPERIVQVRELLDEVLLGSSPGFPASTLGL